MHRNAPLTPEGRLRLCSMIEDGWPVATAAESMRISRQTAHKWWRRYQDAGVAGLEDRSSRPRRCPTKTSDRMERRMSTDRRAASASPARTGPTGSEGRGPSLHVPPGPPAPWTEPALRPRPQGWPGHPSDRDHPCRRTRPHRREEAGQDPQGRWLAGQWEATPPEERARWSTTPWVCLCPLGHRCLQPTGLLGDPCQRAGRHGHRILAAGPGLLRQLRHHRRAGAQRQRQLLPGQGLHCRTRRRRHQSTSSPGPTDPRPMARSNAPERHWLGGYRLCSGDGVGGQPHMSFGVHPDVSVAT